ncbi:MAG: hypothetical protein Q8P31_08370 [Bacillota bacterium]|nr:hypothetical protein [Bacillota bacterium]
MKPMDLQTLLTRSTDVARSRHVEIQRPALAQQQFAAEINRTVVHKQRTVGETPGVRGGRIDRDSKRGRGRESGSGREPGGGPGGDPPNDGAAGPQQGAGKGRLVDVILDLGLCQGGT